MTIEPRRVVVDLTPVLPGGENGGAKIFVLELLHRLPRLAPQCRFVLLTRAESHEELRVLDCANVERLMVLDVPYLNLRYSRLRSFARRVLPWIPRGLREWLRRSGDRFARRRKMPFAESLLHRLGADLLFCPFTAPIYAEPGIPLVSTIHDLQYKTYPQFFSGDDVAHRHATFVDACRQATRLVAVSDYTRKSAIQHGDLDPQRISTIHHRLGGRLVAPPDTDASALDAHGLSPGRYLVYPANFWRHKNHEMLLTALGMAPAYGLPGDIRLVCTGATGPRRDYLMAASNALGLEERVCFRGFVTNAELAVLLANSAGMVFPSLYEGFGLPVLEAMQAGVPVACSDTTSLPELASGAALLFDPRVPADIARAMVELCTDVDCRTRLISRGRERAREFTDADRMAREYWALLCSAMGGARQASALSGVFADGWAGRELFVDVVTEQRAAALELEVLVPGWIPHARLRLEATPCNGRRRRHVSVHRDKTCLWTLPVKTGRLYLNLSPGFVPAQLGMGDDGRELTLMVRRCSVVHESGEREELWGAKQP